MFSQGPAEKKRVGQEPDANAISAAFFTAA
jgi:hypothetical protein